MRVGQSEAAATVKFLTKPRSRDHRRNALTGETGETGVREEEEQRNIIEQVLVVPSGRSEVNL